MATKRYVNGSLVSIRKAVKAVPQEIISEVEAEVKKVEPFLSDTARRALHTFWQSLLPTVAVLLSATSVSDVRTTALSGLAAAGAAALSLVKSAILSKLKGSN